MRLLVRRAYAVAIALPLAVLSVGAALLHRDEAAGRLKQRSAAVPRVAWIVTAPLWLVVVARGLLYPVAGADNLEDSWGGPTLAGAWIVHLAIGVGALAAVSLVLAATLARVRG